MNRYRSTNTNTNTNRNLLRTWICTLTQTKCEMWKRKDFECTIERDGKFEIFVCLSSGPVMVARQRIYRCEYNNDSTRYTHLLVANIVKISVSLDDTWLCCSCFCCFVFSWISLFWIPLWVSFRCRFIRFHKLKICFDVKQSLNCFVRHGTTWFIMKRNDESSKNQQQHQKKKRKKIGK